MTGSCRPSTWRSIRLRTGIVTRCRFLRAKHLLADTLRAELLRCGEPAAVSRGDLRAVPVVVPAQQLPRRGRRAGGDGEAVRAVHGHEAHSHGRRSDAIRDRRGKILTRTARRPQRRHDVLTRTEFAADLRAHGIIPAAVKIDARAATPSHAAPVANGPRTGSGRYPRLAFVKAKKVVDTGRSLSLGRPVGPTRGPA